MASKVAVVVPHHKEELNPLEQISLIQLQRVLGRHTIIFAVPEGKRFSWIPAGRQVMQFPQLGRGRFYYNKMMLSPEFYEAFLDYDYILIYHLDAFVFSDKLEYFCELGYDNIGAPWPYRWSWVNDINFRGKKLRPRVGNSGFGLRNVKNVLKLLKNHPDILKEATDENPHGLNEGGIPDDGFFCLCGTIEELDFHNAPISAAYKFSCEFDPARVVKKNGGELPFGCHGFQHCSADFYIKVFASLGYDLRPFANMLHNVDLIEKQNRLIIMAMTRLNRRIERGYSLIRYLPQNRYASIRVVRHPATILILARLLLENNNLSDEIYFYDESELDILIHDCPPEKLPHLLITMGGGTDINLTNALEKSGLAYGKRVVSFQREYMTYCENLFHNLGK